MENMGFRMIKVHSEDIVAEISPKKFSLAIATCGYDFIQMIISNMVALKVFLNIWNVPEKQVRNSKSS